MQMFQASEQSLLANYKMMMGLIVPRPIAWVTSFGPTGKVNLAPFSAFTFLSPQPPLLGISVGINKDTTKNIKRIGEFVVHIADVSLREPLHLSSIEHAPEISEVDELGLEVTPSSSVSVPRLTIAPAAMECRLHSVSEYGDLKATLIVGEILTFHIRDDLVHDGKVSTADLNPLARLAGPAYSGIGEVIVMQALSAPPPAALPVEKV